MCARAVLALCLCCTVRTSIANWRSCICVRRSMLIMSTETFFNTFSEDRERDGTVCVVQSFAQRVGTTTTLREWRVCHARAEVQREEGWVRGTDTCAVEPLACAQMCSLMWSHLARQASMMVNAVAPIPGQSYYLGPGTSKHVTFNQKKRFTK